MACCCLFFDVAPHQLDLIYHFFGEIDKAQGIALNQKKLYDANDIVAGNILFKNGIIFNGLWCFNVNDKDEKDSCEIVGSKGKISFNVFGEPKFALSIEDKKETFSFDILQHVQQPMIEKVVDYFLDNGPNPCSAEDGVSVMQLMEKFTCE